MTSFLDRVVLFLLSILMFDFNQVDYVTVCLILVVIIMESIIIYFEDKRVWYIILSVFVVLSFIMPQISVFTPLMLYEVVRRRLLIFVPIHIVVFYVTYISSFSGENMLKEVCYSLIFIFTGIFVGGKTHIELEMKNKIYSMRDEQSYLEMKNRQSKEEIIKKQDYEIHAATLTERNRIAREIHDHVGHMLSRSILQLGAILAINKDENMAIPLRGLKDTLDTAMNNIRESVHDLKDDALDLEYMVNDIIKEYKMLEIEFDYDMGNYLSKEIKYCFVAIVKEALTNTVKHSDGNKVSIVMREHPALYQMYIHDNGAAKVINADKTGIGLENMRERVAAFNGNVRFSNENGFKIFISIPKDL